MSKPVNYLIAASATVLLVGAWAIFRFLLDIVRIEEKKEEERQW